jgi:hypothetical protein
LSSNYLVPSSSAETWYHLEVKAMLLNASFPN